MYRSGWPHGYRSIVTLEGRDHMEVVTTWEVIPHGGRRQGNSHMCVCAQIDGWGDHDQLTCLQVPGATGG